MKSIVARRDGSTFSVAIEDVPRPKSAGGELLIKVMASTIQASDIMNAKGSFQHTTFPRITGRDFAGIVVEGRQAWLNKRVFGTSGHDFSFIKDGAHAEFAVVAEEQVAVMPTNFSFLQAASLGTSWSTAALTLERAKPQTGETVLVLGATGSVGSAVVEIARHRGLKVVTVGRHGTDVISSTDPSLSKALDLTAMNGVDIVVDTVGDLALLGASLDVMADLGRLVTITAPRQSDTHLPVDVFKLYRKQLSIVGANSVETPLKQLTASLQELVPGFESGSLPAPAESAWTSISIEQAPDAFAGNVKKAVLLFES